MVNGRFKPVKNKKDYKKELKEWSDAYISPYSVALLISVLFFNTSLKCFLVRLLLAVIFFMFSEKMARSLIAYSFCSFFMWKTGFTVYNLEEMLLYFACFSIGCTVCRFVIMVILSVVELYCNFIMWIIKAKIKNRLPLSKEELETCGVQDRYECLIYYQYMMHGFGKFKKVIFRFEDYEEISITNLLDVFYSFDMTLSAKEKVEEAVKTDLITKKTSDTIYNKTSYSFWCGDHSKQDFIRMLSDSVSLYEKEAAKKP